MAAGRKRYIERLHALGLRAPGGRPPRIPDWLRRAVIEEAEKELAGLDLETILSASPPLDEISEAEKLTDLARFEAAMLLDLLRPAVGHKNRSRSAITFAWEVGEARRLLVERGDKQRTRLDELIEAVAMS